MRSGNTAAAAPALCWGCWLGTQIPALFFPDGAPERLSSSPSCSAVCSIGLHGSWGLQQLSTAEVINLDRQGKHQTATWVRLSDFEELAEDGRSAVPAQHGTGRPCFHVSRCYFVVSSV